MSEEREEYKTNIKISKASDLSFNEASRVINKKLIKIEAKEFGLILTFEDGTKLSISGDSYEGAPLEVWVEE